MDDLARRAKALQEGPDLAADLLEGCHPGLAARRHRPIAQRARSGLWGARRSPLFQTRRPAKRVRSSAAFTTGSCRHRRGCVRRPDRRRRAVRRSRRTLCSDPQADGRGRRSGDRDGQAASLLPRAPASHAGLRTIAGTPRCTGQARPDAHRAVPRAGRRAVPVSCPGSSGAIPAERKGTPRQRASTMPAGQGATKPRGTPGCRPRETRPREQTTLSSSGGLSGAAVSMPAAGTLDGRRGGRWIRPHDDCHGS